MESDNTVERAPFWERAHLIRAAFVLEVAAETLEDRIARGQER